MEKRKFCPAGRILPGVTIVIMDEEGKPQPVGSSGEVIRCILSIYENKRKKRIIWKVKYFYFKLYQYVFQFFIGLNLSYNPKVTGVVRVCCFSHTNKHINFIPKNWFKLSLQFNEFFFINSTELSDICWGAHFGTGLPEETWDDGCKVYPEAGECASILWGQAIQDRGLGVHVVRRETGNMWKMWLYGQNQRILYRSTGMSNEICL